MKFFKDKYLEANKCVFICKNNFVSKRHIQITMNQMKRVQIPLNMLKYPFDQMKTKNQSIFSLFISDNLTGSSYL